MKKKNVLVVLGGTSKERKISFATGRACIKALKKIGYKVNEFDPAKQLLNEIDKSKVDLIFNALHGKDGEDGNAQSYFEYLRIPYTHSGVISSMNAMDKIISKQIFKDNKILSPKYFVLKSSELKKKGLKTLIKKYSLGSSVVIKPSNEGSSIGVKICKNFREINRAINVLKKRYENLIFEKYIGGQEVQVAVLNNKALGAIELKPKRSFYDYKAKYEKSAKTSHIMPANLSKRKYKEVLKIAERTHRILRCKGVTRCDFKYFKNKFYLLEINTQPGMTDLSLVPEIASFKGISFESLVRRIVLDANINK
ncbi:MAG: D-alanine--D-alanine ligase [Candidatus Pelagibacter sp. TMED203]|nr:MAG: D-alanine--D-alanine ligase [Candidatus Pelagibacter sp. TMED203]